MKYKELPEIDQKKLLTTHYIDMKKSFQDIANEFDSYPNKLRRDAKKFKIEVRDKSDAQKNALETGKHKHPTKGKPRSNTTKDKIGLSVMKSWDELDPKELDKRKTKARANWENLSQDAKENMLHEANLAVRKASKIGSKLEHFMLQNLLNDGFKVDFHKEQSILNTKLQIDLFLPMLNTAIEIDGPSHFQPVWGDSALVKNQGYDSKKTGLLLGKGLVLIRIKQMKDFSKARSTLLYNSLKTTLDNIANSFPAVGDRHIELGE